MTRTQLDLFSRQPSKLELAWEKAKQQQPWMLEELARLAFDLKSRGQKHYSVDSLFHVLRFHRAGTKDEHGLKVNNNHTAFAARELMALHPELQGFFQTREQKPRGNYGQIS